MKKIILSFILIVTTFLINAQSTAVLEISCPNQERYNKCIYKKQKKYFKSIDKPILNELFVCGFIVRERKMLSPVFGKHIDCLSSASYVKCMELYNKDTLHTIGLYQVDSIILSDRKSVV